MTTNHDARWLELLGAGLLAVALVFAGRELALSTNAVMVLATCAAVAVAVACEVKELGVVGPLALTLSALGAGLFYALGPGWPGLISALLATSALGWLAWRHREEAEGAHRWLVFVGLAVTSLVSSLVASHFIFYASSLGDVAWVERRVWLTVAWTLAGVGFFVRGSQASDEAKRAAGVFFVIAAMAKLAAWDTGHLAGGLRVAVFGLSGVLLLAGGVTLRRGAGVTDRRAPRADAAPSRAARSQAPSAS